MPSPLSCATLERSSKLSTCTAPSIGVSAMLAPSTRTSPTPPITFALPPTDRRPALSLVTSKAKSPSTLPSLPVRPVHFPRCSSASVPSVWRRVTPSAIPPFARARSRPSLPSRPIAPSSLSCRFASVTWPPAISASFTLDGNSRTSTLSLPAPMTAAKVALMSLFIPARSSRTPRSSESARPRRTA